jgi:hypothetical protein
MLVDAERIERLLSEPKRVDDATMNAIGWHEPKKLDRLRQHAILQLKHRPGLKRDLAVIEQAHALHQLVLAHDAKKKQEIQ